MFTLFTPKQIVTPPEMDAYVTSLLHNYQEIKWLRTYTVMKVIRKLFVEYPHKSPASLWEHDNNFVSICDENEEFYEPDEDSFKNKLTFVDVFISNYLLDFSEQRAWCKEKFAFLNTPNRRPEKTHNDDQKNQKIISSNEIILAKIDLVADEAYQYLSTNKKKFTKETKKITSDRALEAGVAWRKWHTEYTQEFKHDRRMARQALWKIAQQHVLENKKWWVSLKRTNTHMTLEFGMGQHKNASESDIKSPWLPLIKKLSYSGLIRIRSEQVFNYYTIDIMQNNFYSIQDKQQATEEDLRAIVEKTCSNQSLINPRKKI